MKTKNPKSISQSFFAHNKKKNKTHGSWKIKRESGQTMMEFALVITLVIILFAGVIDFSRMSFAWASGHFAVRAASRYAIGASGNHPHYADCSGIESIVRRDSWFLDIDEIQIYYDHGSPETVFSNCNPTTRLVTGDRVTVKLKGHFSFIVLPLETGEWQFVSRHSVIYRIPIVAGFGGGGQPTQTPVPTPTFTPTPTPVPTPTPTPTPLHTPTPCIWPFCW